MEPSAPLLVAQALASGGLAWPGRARWPLPPPVRAAATAATAAGAAVAATGAGLHGRLLTPHVEPPGEARLLTTGPYRLSRHPIYAGLVLAGGGVAVLRRRPEPLVAWVVLAAVLHRKSRLEERWLAVRFGRAWDEYARRTPLLLGRPSR